MRLCKYCGEDFPSEYELGNCYVCGNKLEQFIDWLEGLEKKALQIPEGARFFYVSIPNSPSLKEMMVREEELFDFGPKESIKSKLIKKSLEIIAKKTSLAPSPVLADVVYELTFPKFSISARLGNQFIFGKYQKLCPNISQKRWKKYEISVESAVGESVATIFGAKEYYMHASGREDADAINIAPRPFVLELKSTQKKWLDLKSISIDSECIKASLLGYVPPSFVKLVSDSHFDKSYRAYLDTRLSEEEKGKLNGFSALLMQRTPKRVAHRRANKLRKRMIYNVSVGEDDRGTYLDIDAEAGTYIKEFISGDGGRTKPSVSSIIGREVTCSFLIVTKIKDGFLDLVFKHSRIGLL